MVRPAALGCVPGYGDQVSPLAVQPSPGRYRPSRRSLVRRDGADLRTEHVTVGMIQLGEDVQRGLPGSTCVRGIAREVCDVTRVWSKSYKSVLIRAGASR